MFLTLIKAVYTFLIDTFQTLLLAASIFLVIYIFIARPFQVTGESMFPTYKNGEYVLTNLIGMRLGDPIKGEVIVFKSPTDAEKDFIKRVIATPGDSVMLQNGSVYVNNVLLNESAYLDPSVKTYGGSFLRENENMTVPQGSYFVMGDNRPASSDSREWGFLKRDAVIGSSFFVYWPPQNARVIHNPFE